MYSNLMYTSEQTLVVVYGLQTNKISGILMLNHI